MDYENLTNNLKLNIDKLKSLLDDGLEKDFSKKYISDLAKEYGYEILGIADSLYIQKGSNPKAIAHINVDSKSLSRALDYTNEDLSELVIGNEFYLVNALLVIASLVSQSENDFDILITNNNIQKDIKSYSSLNNILRSSNIINLNLRHPKSIADEFSALMLSSIRVPVTRFEPDFSYKSFRICISNLIGGRAGEDIDKVRLNSIKTLVSFIRKIKSKVDLDVTGFEAGDRYDNIPNSGEIYFIIKDEYVNDLMDTFDLFKNELIEKNLKHEPDIKINLEELENEDCYPLTDLSFSHLSSFVELLPTGAFSVDNTNNQLISSINLATARSQADYINFIVVFRSLSEEMMNQMVEKTDTAMTISSSQVAHRFTIPRWKNKDESLTKIFKNVYKELTGEELEVIKSQYSLDSSIIFKNLDVKMISLGVEYKQGDNGKFYTKLADILQTSTMIDNVLTIIE